MFIVGMNINLMLALQIRANQVNAGETAYHRIKNSRTIYQSCTNQKILQVTSKSYLYSD